MKTIQFRTQDQTQWTININQITCFFQRPDSNGTYVRLSCGKELHTLLSPSQLSENIKMQLES